MTLIRFKASQEQDADLSITYDAVVVGSGAAGGMAAHVLTSQGMKVLLLEAGKKIDINAELRSMEWPYDHPRRGEAPPGYHAATRMVVGRSEEHTSELQSHSELVCRLLLEKTKPTA